MEVVQKQMATAKKPRQFVKKFPHCAKMSLTQFSSTVTTKYSQTALSFRSGCINCD